MLRIVAADTAAALLGNDMNAQLQLATAAVLVEFPYLQPRKYLVELGPFPPDSRSLVREFKLALALARACGADEIHIDSTLGGVRASELSGEKLRELGVSARGREMLMPILDELRELGELAERELGVPALMIGKDSLAVRIAELTAGAASVAVGVSLATERGTVLVGLPKYSSFSAHLEGRDGRTCSLTRDRVTVINWPLAKRSSIVFQLRSLHPSEGGVLGTFRPKLPKGSFRIVEFPNPKATRFNALLIELLEQ